MYHKEEILAKIREAQERHVDDFEFIDHEGKKNEVHLKRINTEWCFNDWFWL